MLSVNDMSKKVVVAGHICLDITPGINAARVDSISDIIRPGSLLNVGKADIHTGGAVANTGLALKKLGADVTLAGKIGDDEFAAFYIDATEKPDRYVGKEVVFTGMVLKAKEANDRSFLLGRIAMTCCSEDLSTFAFICDCDGSLVLNTDEWLTITCIMDKDYSDKYDVWHPVCKVTEISGCEAPEEKIINVT